MANIPYGGEGVPSGIDTQEFSHVELLAGHEPGVLVVPGFKGDGSVAIPAFTVVGVTAGNLVFGEQDGAPLAIGITAAPILANGTVQKVGLIRGGNLNINALNWHASFDTDAKKLAAFDGAPSPTRIVLQKIA